jgi:hypothetical protein
MPLPRRHIRLSFVETGESAIAEMLDDEAPLTCKLVWDMLPVEHELYHGRYSGMEAFVLLDEYQPAPDEERTQLPLPGEILYWSDTGSAVTSNGEPVAEILFAFGRGVTLRGAEGVRSFANLFARIPGDWKYDWVDFAQACGRIRLQGTQALRIERVEE